MKHPPYHLRSNKAVDRYLFVELLKKIFEGGPNSSEKYTYVGFGGPFLEDIKVAEHYFPEMKFVSLERDEETIKRQRFHKFCRRIRLMHKSDEQFTNSLTEGTLLSLWFDFLGCEPRNIATFADAVRKSGNWSILRITLNASMPRDEGKANFIRDFQQLLPVDYEDYFETQEKFPILLQRIVHAATTPLIGSNYQFQILNASSYRDGSRMLTITGLKCPVTEWKQIKRIFSKWRFFTRTWSQAPESINVPDLSIQERMHLASLLPTSSKNPAKHLSRRLGYSIGSEDSLKNYAAFCRYFPVFSRLAF